MATCIVFIFYQYFNYFIIEVEEKQGKKYIRSKNEDFPSILYSFESFLSLFFSFFLSFFLRWKYSMQRKMISPLSSMSVRFKLRAICRILFLIFTTLSPHYRSRPDVSRVNINTRVSLSFFSHARSIFQWSLSHLLRFLLSCSISEQVSGSPYSSLYFLPESERNSIIFLVRRLLYVRSDISIWKMEEIVEKRKKHSSFQIVLEFFENYTIYILRNFREILKMKFLSVFFCRVSLPRIKM